MNSISLHFEYTHQASVNNTVFRTNALWWPTFSYLKNLIELSILLHTYNLWICILKIIMFELIFTFIDVLKITHNICKLKISLNQDKLWDPNVKSLIHWRNSQFLPWHKSFWFISLKLVRHWHWHRRVSAIFVAKENKQSWRGSLFYWLLSWVHRQFKRCRHEKKFLHTNILRTFLGKEGVWVINYLSMLTQIRGKENHLLASATVKLV